MKKTFILNEKTAKCKTCKHFTGVGCMVNRLIPTIPTFANDFCDLHSDLVDTPAKEDELTPERKAFIKKRIDGLFAAGFTGRGHLC